jgi:diguanylate cyclase (GGDEF)-like protein
MNRRDLFLRLPLLAAPRIAHADPDVLLTPEEQAWVTRHPVVLYAPERDFPPFSFVDSQGQHRGLSADLLELLHRHTGLKFQAVAAATRAENIERIKRREIDLLTSLRPTPEREAFRSFTGPYVSSPAVVLRRRDDRRGGDLPALAGQRVGVDRGSATQQFLAQAAPSVIQVPGDVAADTLRQLAFGETDAAVVNLATASFLITRERIVGLRVAGELSYYSTLTLGYRKDWPLFGRVLEKGLAQVTEAERNALVTRWIPLSDLAWWQRAEVQRVLGVSAIATGLVLGGLLLWNHALRRAVAQQTEALRKELAERHRLEQRLRTLAEHDPLTGLMNRAALTEALRRSLALAARQKWSVAVVFIDLDGFKQINDTLGHAAGDELLRQIAARLSNSLRESDLLGRLGGDEFIVVAEALHDGPRNAFELTDKLLLQMKRPFPIDGHSCDVGFSAGIAIFPGDGDTPEQLIANADVAMYRAKAQGRFRAALFRREADDAAEIAGVAEAASPPEGLA